MGVFQSQPWYREKDNIYFLFNAGNRSSCRRVWWSREGFEWALTAPLRKPKDILCMIDVKAKNIREILVRCGGCNVMRFRYPEGTDVVENLDILGVHAELPRFIMNYQDLMLDIQSDTKPEVTEYVREPTESDMEDRAWVITVPECPENYGNVHEVQFYKGHSMCTFRHTKDSEETESKQNQ